MHSFIATGTPKLVKTTTKFELITAQSEKGAISGLVYEARAGEIPLIAFAIDGNPIPFEFYRIGGDQLCVSYGHDWVIEVPLGLNYEVLPNAGIHSDRIICTDEGFVISVQAEAKTPPPGFPARVIRLRDFVSPILQQQSICSKQFSIWMSQHHRDNTDEPPLLEVS